MERGRSILVYREEGAQPGGEPHREPQRSVVELMLVWVRQVPGDASSPWQIAVDAYW